MYIMHIVRYREVRKSLNFVSLNRKTDFSLTRVLYNIIIFPWEKKIDANMLLQTENPFPGHNHRGRLPRITIQFPMMQRVGGINRESFIGCLSGLVFTTTFSNFTFYLFLCDNFSGSENDRRERITLRFTDRKISHPAAAG